MKSHVESNLHHSTWDLRLAKLDWKSKFTYVNVNTSWLAIIIRRFDFFSEIKLPYIFDWCCVVNSRILQRESSTNFIEFCPPKSNRTITDYTPDGNCSWFTSALYICIASNWLRNLHAFFIRYPISKYIYICFLFSMCVFVCAKLFRNQFDAT